jgi:SAM-dependent methyltransferase
LVKLLVFKRAETLPADEALRFLFRLDAAFYSLEGLKAIEYDHGIHTKHRHTGYHDFFIRRIRSGESVLDVGCGNGSLARDMAERAHAFVFGIDFSPKNIAQAQKGYSHPRVQYEVGDALEIMSDRQFDVIVLSNILEHLAERSSFLARLRELARPSRFLIRVPLFERDWRVPLKRELNVEWRLDPTHETEYSLESFAAELAAGGLEITHQEVRWGEIWAEATPETLPGS